MTTNSPRHASWAELHNKLFMAQPGFAEAVQEACAFDWAAIPVSPPQSHATPLRTAIASAQVGAFQLMDGRQVFWETLQQRNLLVTPNLARTYHPFDRVKRSLAKMAIDWPASKTRQFVLPPMQLSSRRILVTIDNEKVDGELAQLPPIECMGLLRGKALHAGERDSFLALLWYQEGFGIDPDAIELIRLLDWPRLARPLDRTR